MDGWITIGTKIDTSKLPKDLKTIEKEIRKREQDLAYTSFRADDDEAIDNLARMEEELEELKKRRDELVKSGEKIEPIELPPLDESAFVGVEKRIEALNYKIEEERLLIEALKSEKPFEGQERSIAEAEARLEKYITQQKKLKGELQQVNKEQGKLPKTLDNVSSGMGKLIKKVGKYALAVFGVRSAYLAIRQAMSTISQYDTQLASDIEYIKYALAMSLKPVIEWIINAVKTLLQYINYFYKRLTGKDLFSGIHDYLRGANKQAKELKKTLAGFDEINILGSEDSGSGSKMPSFDLTEEPDTKVITSWSEKVKKIVIGAFDNIRDNVEKVLRDLGASEAFIASWRFATDGVSTMFEGLVDTISGVLDMIVGLATGNTEMVKDGFVKLITGIGELIWGLVKFVLGVFAMILTSLYDLLIKPFWEGIKVLVKGVGNFFGDLWSGLKTGAKTAWESVKSAFSGVGSFFSGMWDKIKSGFSKVGTKVGEAVSSAFKAVVNGVLWTIEKVLNSPIKTVNSLIGVINKIPGINIGKLPTFSLPRLATGGIVDVPRTGVNMGSYVAGERGKEGILPLTNPEAMRELGQEIGKWITLNVDLTNTIDGRVLNNRLEQIRANNSFARNGVR